MKTELVNFVNDLPQAVFSYNLSLSEGLYIFVDLDEEGNLLGLEKQVYTKPKAKQKKETAGKEKTLFTEVEIAEEESEMNPFFQRCLEIRSYLQPVSSFKILNPNKKIFNSTCSAFAIGFKKKILLDNMEKNTDIKKEIEQYFKGASLYVSNDNHKRWFNQFKQYCIENLINTIIHLPEYQTMKVDFSINIFLNSPQIVDFKEVYEAYLKNNVFNKEDYQEKIEDEVYNIAESLSGFNDKKLFLRHKTAPFEFNYRLTSAEAKIVWQFFGLQRRKVFPNPLPIFIDKKELNQKVIKLLKEDGTIRYNEIIKKLFEETKQDIGNYYLLFFQKGELIDLDFVPSFQYEITDMEIIEIFPIGGKSAKKINNIFEFEKEITNPIFNGQLVKETKIGLWLQYFGDIEFNPNMSDNTYNQVLKYRKAFYDYVYKAKRSAIQSFMFHDIMRKGVLDDIRADEYKDSKHSKEYAIKQKLNIWFSLYNYFDFNNLTSHNNMANKTQSLLEQTKKIAASDEEVLQNDEEFAFASGQLIHYLLGQSAAGDRTHALLEPFLQKTEARLFKLAIARAFDTYKHEIPFYKGNTRYAFDRIMSQVMGFEPDTVNMKDLLPFILAGYFSETIFKKQSNS